MNQSNEPLKDKYGREITTDTKVSDLPPELAHFIHKLFI